MKDIALKKEELRLYAVSPVNAPDDYLLRAGKAGATIAQLREKTLSRTEVIEKARRIMAGGLNIPLIINDDAEAAKASGAQGVHVGQDDTEMCRAREILGPDKIVGVSCVNLAQALKARQDGADYLGVGAMFATDTKIDAAHVPLTVLRAICRSVNIPVVAIGGISEENVEQLAGSGIAGSAVVSAIFQNGDIERNCRKFAAANNRMLDTGVKTEKMILMDIDGVVLDSLELWDWADRTYLAEQSLLNETNLAYFHQCRTLEEAAVYLRQLGKNISDAQFKARFEELLTEGYRERVPLLPGIKDKIMARYRSGYALTIFTATPEKLIMPALRRLGLADIFTGGLFEVNKRETAAYYRALECTGFGITETFIADDTPDFLNFAETLGIGRIEP